MGQGYYDPENNEVIQAIFKDVNEKRLREKLDAMKDVMQELENNLIAEATGDTEEEVRDSLHKQITDYFNRMTNESNNSGE